MATARGVLPDRRVRTENQRASRRLAPRLQPGRRVIDVAGKLRLVALAICLISIACGAWCLQRVRASYLDPSWPRNFPYPDTYLLALNDYYDARWPAPPGTFKMHGEVQLVQLTVIGVMAAAIGCLCLCIAPAILRHRRSRRRQENCQCPACGYRLNGLICPRCPECGADVSSAAVPAAVDVPKRRRSPPPPGLLALAGIALYAMVLLHWCVYILGEWWDLAPARPMHWWRFRYAAAAIVLFCLFVQGYRWRLRRRRYLTMMSATCVALVLWQVHDSRQGNWQYGVDIPDSAGQRVTVDDFARDYINWPWLTTIEGWLR